MKKQNNKYRNNNYNNNNNNNQIYSLNYKFDSTSPAGKFNGTALDLIKRYNELAKDAQSNNDYVMAEVYRQYAEHYRKIVTDINEKKQQQQQQRNNNLSPAQPKDTAEINAAPTAEANITPANDSALAEYQVEALEPAPAKKSFTVIEVKEDNINPQPSADKSAPAETPAPKKRVYRKRTTAKAVAETTPSSENATSEASAV